MFSLQPETHRPLPVVTGLTHREAEDANSVWKKSGSLPRLGRPTDGLLAWIFYGTDSGIVGMSREEVAFMWRRGFISIHER